jgi:DNA-binding cell septation regulator SpoVG
VNVRLSEIEVVPIKPRNGLVAFASFVINESLYVGDVAIHSRLGGEGFRLVYPMRTLRNGASVNTLHPIRKDVAEEIEHQVSEAYQKLLAKIDEAQTRRGDDIG